MSSLDVCQRDLMWKDTVSQSSHWMLYTCAENSSGMFQNKDPGNGSFALESTIFIKFLGLQHFEIYICGVPISYPEIMKSRGWMYII